MDDNAKSASSYQSDQEILDARGINMTVEEVAGLPTTKYSERVQSLNLCEGDLMFLKGLRRRIKNRLASQNSRRRSVEHLSRLARELRAARACREDALSERRELQQLRDAVRGQCTRLRRHVARILKEREDPTPIPSITIESTESQCEEARVTETKPPPPQEKGKDSKFECRIEKLVQQSVNHIFKNDKKTVFAKTVFISNDKLSSDVKSMVLEEDLKVLGGEGVLNLSVKEGRRKSHGRKQSAPRRILYYDEININDGVLDLKVKKGQ
ncbi:uncharacterized protein LOC128682019 isoform X2 [Plodia interpunctella]|uniref:uncharacterized protein LOC128682019 isoform X2 n=1 Tax=Plodia interpunctella TaxID=58824 RepID=UPI0023684B4D|nr:uncharacterized protein LOC128682019 isoform X2 [Plodia interpunctella]